MGVRKWRRDSITIHPPTRRLASVDGWDCSRKRRASSVTVSPFRICFKNKKKKIVDASIEDRNFEKEKERSEFAFLS